MDACFFNELKSHPKPWSRRRRRQRRNIVMPLQLAKDFT